MSFAEKVKAGFQRRYISFELPCGETVRIRNLTEREKSLVDAKAVDHKKGRINREAVLRMRADYIVACVVNENGDLEFSPRDVDMLCENLDSLDSSVLYGKIVEHTGGDADDFENLVGNSSETPGDSSP